MSVKTIPISDLIEDLEVYPRHAVDLGHVADLVQALRSGAILPPPVTDQRKRIVDGWHRVRAYRKHLGPEASIDVDVRSYKSEADVVADAIALNSVHGRKLDKQDQVRAARMAMRAGISEKKVAILLHVTEAKIEQLKIRVAFAPRESEATIPDTREVPLKRAFTHLQGEKLTTEQVAAHRSQAGTSLLLQARQLRDALLTDLANEEDGKLWTGLDELVAAIEGWKSRHARPEVA